MPLNGYFKLISNLYQYKLLVMSYLPPPSHMYQLVFIFPAICKPTGLLSVVYPGLQERVYFAFYSTSAH